MKKFITIAALLAAGTAFLNAEVVLTADTSALAASAGTYTVSGVSVGSGYGDYSVTVGLDVAALAEHLRDTTKNTVSLFLVNGASASIGAWTGYSSSGNVATSKSIFGDWGANTTYYWFSKTEGEGDSAIDVGLSYTNLMTEFNSNNYTGAALTLTFTSSGTSAYLTLTADSGAVTTYEGLAGSLRGSGFGALRSLTYNSAYVNYFQVDNEVLDSSSATSANLAVIAAIPEPSAFGLLAGIGALALVASRRRRK